MFFVLVKRLKLVNFFSAVDIGVPGTVSPGFRQRDGTDFIQGDHLSGKQGNVSDFSQNQGIVREKSC